MPPQPGSPGRTGWRAGRRRPTPTAEVFPLPFRDLEQHPPVPVAAIGPLLEKPDEEHLFEGFQLVPARPNWSPSPKTQLLSIQRITFGPSEGASVSGGAESGAGTPAGQGRACGVVLGAGVRGMCSLSQQVGQKPEHRGAVRCRGAWEARLCCSPALLLGGSYGRDCHDCPKPGFCV